MNTFIRKKRMQTYFHIHAIWRWFAKREESCVLEQRQWSPNFPSREEKLTELFVQWKIAPLPIVDKNLVIIVNDPVMHCARYVLTTVESDKNIAPPSHPPSIPARNHREKLCSLHRDTFTSPIVTQTGVRIFYGTCCYEWRISGVLLFFFFFFSLFLLIRRNVVAWLPKENSRKH